MHKLLIAAVLSLFATAANAAPSCMSKQVCIDSDKGYCRYAVTDNGRCWSTNVAFLKKVKAGKAGRSERRASKPPSKSEPKTRSEPTRPIEPSFTSEPSPLREPTSTSEPLNGREPSALSEPVSTQEPNSVSEPSSRREPKIVSEPPLKTETIVKSAPPSPREPKRSSWDITLLGVFTFASAFMGFTAARVLNEHPLYWGKPTLPPPPLDLANSPYRLIPGAAPEVLHLPREHSMSLHLVAKPRWH